MLNVIQFIFLILGVVSSFQVAWSKTETLLQTETYSAVNKNLSNSQLKTIVTDNKELSKKIYKDFVDKEMTSSLVKQFLVENHYLLAELVVTEDKIIIKNPYQIIFIIRGHQFYSEKEIRGIIKIDKNKIGSFFYNFIKKQIQSSYKENGFFKVEIKKSEKQKDWKKWFVINISEGKRMRLQDLQVRGLLSKPFSFYEDVIVQSDSELEKGFFNKKKLEQGYKFLINHLKSEGYLQSKIYSDRIFFKDNQAFVTVNLEEGPLTFITDIQIKGVEAFTVWEILSLMESKVQSTLKINVIKNDLSKIEQLYKERGYSQMKVLNKKNIIRYKPGDIQALLNIEIEEGKSFFISKINLKGLKQVNKKLVSKLLTFKTGDVLTTNKIDSSTQKLASTGLFTNINIKRTIVEDQLIVSVLFNEKKKRNLKGGLGFNSQRGFTTRAYTELTHRNLFGWGRAFITRGSGQVNLTKSHPFLEYEVSGRYKEIFSPGAGYEGDMNVSKSKSVFKYSLENINFVEKTLLSFFINKKITNKLKVRWTILSFENRKEACTVSICPSNPQQIASTSMQTYYDKRDNIFDPSKGYLLSFMTEWASPYLGSSSDISFMKLDVNSYFYWTFWTQYTLGVVFKSGYIFNTQNSQYLPVSRSFILGGQSSLRGYDGNIEGERIPRKRYTPIETANEPLKLKQGNFLDNVLNSQYNLFKMDIRFPIFKGFKGVLFYDLGTAYLTSRTNSLLDYGHSIGVGFRYQTFFIPIGLDIAYQLTPKECIPVEEGACAYSRFHFSIGW